MHADFQSVQAFKQILSGPQVRCTENGGVNRTAFAGGRFIKACCYLTGELYIYSPRPEVNCLSEWAYHSVKNSRRATS